MMEEEKEKSELWEYKTASENIFDGVVLHVRKDTVKLPDGSAATREFVKHVGAVAIVPITADGKIIIERQFRYPVNEIVTEIPAGKLDYVGENYLEAAKRELREETGISASKWTELGLFYPAAAYTSEKIMMFIAQGLTYGERELDDDEFLNVTAIPVGELVEMIMRGEIPDAKTQAAVLRAAAMIADKEKK